MSRPKSARRRHHNCRQLELENLEDRRMLAITLPPSTFEIDGDTAANHGGIDWSSAAVTSSPNFSLKTDLTKSTDDDALGQGSSENDTNITVVTGSIPNSK